MTLDYWLSQPILILATIAVAVLGVGRLTRILFYDAFPPAVAARMAWDRLTGDGSWSKLAHCPWCLAPWVMLAAMGWFFLGFLVFWIWVAWWIFWGWMALSYVTSMIIVRDEPAD